MSDSEIGPHTHMRRVVDGQLIELSIHFGLGQLKPVELIDLEYQIAQKIRAVTDLDYARAHDLVDLQLLWDAGPDLASVREFCVPTLDFRCAQEWRPLPLRAMDGWDPAYRDARGETEVGGNSFVLEGIDSAREWFGQVIASIDAPRDIGSTFDPQVLEKRQRRMLGGGEVFALDEGHFEQGTVLPRHPWRLRRSAVSNTWIDRDKVSETCSITWNP
ncbi:nucleotidyl transferase AbiEii/AbiGii toxin family protein [Paenarthrobacter sp. NPDC056912]|uniref:nucleotidyl transferase AbiEii/AbiGii toxin family protein n=1 Tax=Paenarthrobacter sp. NPDC056912 TaxID=3345965 RepID=UPI00366C7791